jgi:CRISPR-associated endonuclease/helicase Cas3
MTATLPKTRRDQLERQCKLTVYDEKPEDLRKVADADRYRLRRLKDKNEAIGVARQGLIERKKILWVVNTVARAQQLTEEIRRLATEVGGQVLCYHSRFTLDDRKKWHGEVVRVFKPGIGEPLKAIIAITTQVCEMSLDLDADILISEDAPITALIQRMGRCNRKTELPLAGIGEVYVYKPSDDLPYSKEDLQPVDAFLIELARLNAIKQSDLEVALAKHGKKAPAGDRFVTFTGSGPYADGDAEDFRDLDERTSPGILDLDEYLKTEKVKRPGLIVPVPRKLKAPRCSHKDAKYLVLAPRNNYDVALGLCDQPIN